MIKKHYCQCVLKGKKIRCVLQSNLGMKFRYCPYDRGFANWVEWIHPKFSLIRGVIVQYMKKTVSR